MNRIDRKEAERLFHEADSLYRAQRYADSLDILNRLNDAFPNQHRILFPRARCLAKLGQFQDALTVCQTLVEEHDYDKAKPLLDQLTQHQAAPSTVEIEPYLESGFETPPPTDGRAFDSKIDLESPPPIGISAIERKKRRKGLRIKPVRTALLILIGLAVWQGWMVWWLGAGLAAGYFALKFALGRLLMRLFETPFRMKGAALRDATAQVHEVRRCPAPAHDEEFDEDEGPREWYQIDVTITPVPNDGPFKLWEPGELGLAPVGFSIRKADDIDSVYQVTDCRFVEPESNGQDGEDDGCKVHGPNRVVLTVGVPPGMHHAQFAYYFETFGEVQLS